MSVALDVAALPHGWVSIKPRSFSPAVRDQMRAIGAAWDPGEKLYRLPVEAAGIVLRTLREAKAAGGTLPHNDITELHKALGNEDLYRYQREGTAFIVDRVRRYGGALLVDDMGLGKSAQTLRAAREIGARSVGVVCPAVVVRHWVEEGKRWAPELVVVATSYERLRTSRNRLPTQFDLKVIDEVHYVANSRAGRSKAVRAFVDEEPRVPVVALSGTPFDTRLRDLWNPLDTIFPNRFGTWFQFTKRYCAGQFVEIKGVEKPVWRADGSSNELELRERLSAVMLRREKSAVLDLPERQRIMIPVELSERALDAFARAAAHARDGDALGRLLGQIEAHKIKAAIELAKDMTSQGRRPLLYTTRKETARQLGEALECPWVTGDVSADTRREQLLAGDGPGVATLFSVTTGINLIEFDTVIFVGLWWQPNVMKQAEDRLHRIGQRRSVSNYFLIGLRTIDEVIRERVVERLERFDRVIGNASDSTSMAATLSGEDEGDLLDGIVAAVQRYNSKRH